MIHLCLRIFKEGDVDLESISQGDFVYRVHDYAYVAAASDEVTSRRHIMRIERLFTNNDGLTLARGIWCYRPEETFHLATRKFLKNVSLILVFTWSKEKDFMDIFSFFFRNYF